ncbi:MAG: ribonuclease H-like domain-containing protein [Pyrinomonadaceae bacterium]
MNYTARRTVTIDIETLPSLHPVESDGRGRRGGKDMDDHARTALSGDFGRILCIGFADEDGLGGISRGCLGWDDKRKRFNGDERQILNGFWQMMRRFRPNVDRVIGHNLFDFDLKFIYKRSVVHGVKPSVELSFARYRNQPLFDTMCEWERWGYGSKISLDRLAHVLNLPSSKSDGVDGSQVCELYTAGEHEKIYDYCLRDVELTRLIYRRMTFVEDVACGTDCTDAEVHLTTRELESREAVATVF